MLIHKTQLRPAPRSRRRTGSAGSTDARHEKDHAAMLHLPRGREDAACGKGTGPEFRLPCQASGKNQPAVLFPRHL